ncbi:uncharacterized protein LOC134811239 [Bolinopsis microptera]|uniref:uncharacterized protein LOC134811239 n=1 Tax=Bolinopsis microptera TaxID=2820187 RepID=UPI003079CD04
MNPSVFCASYHAVTPIHCTVHLRETDISLKGPKYHNLMEERLLQSRLNHLENQLRRTTLVTQRQQLHIQKTLNNIPKPSKNLDRRVAEAFRFIMAEEVYNQKVDTTNDKEKTSSSKISSQSSDSHHSSCSSISGEQNRLLRVVQRKPSTIHSKYDNTIKTGDSRAATPASASNENWKVASKRMLPAIRFQRRVLVMEPSSTRSQRSNIIKMQDKGPSDDRKIEGTDLKNNLWKSAGMVVKQRQIASQLVQRKTQNPHKPDPEPQLQTPQKSERWSKAWKTISYRRRASEDVTNKWKSLLGAVKNKNR